MNGEIKRGEIYFADLNPVVGSEQGGIRPVVIVQNNVGNHYSPTVIIAPITSKRKRNMPTHVGIEMETFGLRPLSYIMLEQIRTIDRARLKNYIGITDEACMRKVDKALLISLELENK